MCILLFHSEELKISVYYILKFILGFKYQKKLPACIRLWANFIFIRQDGWGKNAKKMPSLRLIYSAPAVLIGWLTLLFIGISCIEGQKALDKINRQNIFKSQLVKTKIFYSVENL